MHQLNAQPFKYLPVSAYEVLQRLERWLSQEVVGEKLEISIDRCIQDIVLSFRLRFPVDF